MRIRVASRLYAGRMPRPSRLQTRRLRVEVSLEELFCSCASSEGDVFWLDAGPRADTGWSILGVGGAESDNDAPGRVSLDVVDEHVDGPPFRGGWVGWLDYETGASACGAPVAATADEPAWLGVERAVALDHVSGSVWALAPAGEIDAWVSHLEAFSGDSAYGDEVRLREGEVEAEARHKPDEYRGMIEACREAIRAGSAYQLCLTTRFAVPGAHDPVRAYLRLRSATPAHHGGFIRIAGRSLLSASPELFLQAGRGRVVTRPIKGTRPRSADVVEDAALAAELSASVKERAENVMIVDLMRNDLSRICEPGTVRVDGLWEVESYPAVHQLVSTVSGALAPGSTVADLWRAAFPAGSMTGAPKLSAMTILHALEQHPRGVYSGCFGYVGLDAVVDFAMVIRSIRVDADHAWIGAGGGITWGSDPDAEVAEVAIKARAPLAALGARLPASWQSE